MSVKQKPTEKVIARVVAFDHAMKHVQALPQLISEHNALCATLYPKTVKPKLHQLMHIPEDMQSVGRLLSCFPTERKHRAVKTVGLHLFRNFEHTLLHDMVSQRLMLIQDESAYPERAMLNPQEVHVDGRLLYKSAAARLPCSEVRPGDLVLHSGAMVAEIQCFWSSDDLLMAQVAPLQRAESESVWSHTGQGVSFIDSSDIVCALAWAPLRQGVVRVCLPVAL